LRETNTDFVFVRDECRSLELECVLDLEKEAFNSIPVPFEQVGLAELWYADRTRGTGCDGCRRGSWRWRGRREPLYQGGEH
jgi:hypothetical protein